MSEKKLDNTESVIKSIPLNRLKFFPITLFAITMGLSGLTIVYQKLHEIVGISAIFGQILAYTTLIIFIVLSLIYITKIIKYPSQVKQEFLHPIRINFFAAISISLLLLSIAYTPLNTDVAKYMWYIGVILHFTITLYILSFWINHNFEIHHSNPAWFIPIVGNVIVPVVGVEYAHPEISMYFFAVGTFFWLSLFTIIFNRIVFHHQLVEKFTPTIFIFIAPPAICFIAYYKLTGQYDFTAKFLYDIALLFIFLIIFMFRNFLKLKFFISWWAFTFPMAAITIATLLRYKLEGAIFFLYLGELLAIITTIIISIVTYKTILHMIKGEICIYEK
jgi:tellurite resistance protein